MKFKNTDVAVQASDDEHAYNVSMTMREKTTIFQACLMGIWSSPKENVVVYGHFYDILRTSFTKEEIKKGFEMWDIKWNWEKAIKE